MYVADDPCSITSAAVASAREMPMFPSTCPCSASSTTCFAIASATNTYSTSTAAGTFAINRTRDGWNCNKKRKADRADMLQVVLKIMSFSFVTFFSHYIFTFVSVLFLCVLSTSHSR